MKGHLELFEHRLKQVGEKLPGMEGKDIDAVFDAFVEALGTDEVPVLRCAQRLHTGRLLQFSVHPLCEKTRS